MLLPGRYCTVHNRGVAHAVLDLAKIGFALYIYIEMKARTLVEFMQNKLGRKPSLTMAFILFQGSDLSSSLCPYYVYL